MSLTLPVMTSPFALRVSNIIAFPESLSLCDCGLACRKLLGHGSNFVERTAARRLGGRHDGALDNRRVTDHDQIPTVGLQHLHRSFSVGPGAAEINQDGNAFGRPRVVNGVDDQRHVGPEAAVGIATAERDFDFTADHLAHHIGSAFGDVLGMRHNDNPDGVIHGRASNALQTACKRTQLERAPGSAWPTLRGPRKAARALLACIGTVRSTASRAVTRTRSITSGRSASAFSVSSTGYKTSSMVFSPACERPRLLTGPTAPAKPSTRSSGKLRFCESASPAARKKVP